jgi:hypothetical protein
MANPYETLQKNAFWRTAIADKNPLEFSSLWKPKFVPNLKGVATAGSCFAQHLSRAIAANGFKWIDAEPAPHEISEGERGKYGYGLFSFRTGNIYTVASLRQWIEAAFGVKALPIEWWEQGGRFYDPLRPGIEPNGFESAAEAARLRETTLAAIRSALSSASLFVFTLGLTEGWRNRETGLVYAMCPGTVAGTFSEEKHEFHNFSYPEIRNDLNACLRLLKQHNPVLQCLLTVSPVPLTATASGHHVLVATTYSKSLLRSVTGIIAQETPFVEYFPSYEIISSFPYRGMFFGPNMRSVSQAGVDHVMSHFFSGIGVSTKSRLPPLARQSPQPMTSAEDDVFCEDAMLEAFA